MGSKRRKTPERREDFRSLLFREPMLPSTGSGRLGPFSCAGREEFRHPQYLQQVVLPNACPRGKTTRPTMTSLRLLADPTRAYLRPLPFSVLESRRLCRKFMTNRQRRSQIVEEPAFYLPSSMMPATKVGRVDGTLGEDPFSTSPGEAAVRGLQ